MKSNTNFRTVPVTGEGGRLPEKDGKYIVKRYNTDDLSECNYEKIEEFDKYWNRFIEFWLEEIPEQAEHENPFCPYCGLMKFNPGNGVMHQLCICTDWSKQPESSGKNNKLTKIIIHLDQLINNFKILDGNTELEILEMAVSDLKDLRHELANQPTPKPTDEDIERASRIYLMNIPMDGTPYTREDVDLAYQAGAKDCRDGNVKPKN